MCLMKYLLVKKKHFDQHEKDGLKVTSNELSISSDSTKSIEYPRARLSNCFRERNVYFFFFFLLLDSSLTPLLVDEWRNQLREASFASFSLPPVVDSTATPSSTCFFESSINTGLTIVPSKFEKNIANQKYSASKWTHEIMTCSPYCAIKK